jgi:hypothetical protein
MKVFPLTLNSVNVELSVSTTRRHIWRAEVHLHSFLTSAIGGGEWGMTPRPLYPRRKHKHPLNRRLLVSGAGLDGLEKRTFS